MKSILSSFIIALLIISCASPKKNSDLVVINQPAEFEAQEAIWLIWPSTNHKESESVENVTLSIIEALINDTDIVVTCKNKELLNKASETLKNRFGAQKRLKLLEIPSFEIWTRDMGPIFVETNQKTVAIADFNFNSWGYADTLDVDTKTEEMYDVRVAKHFKLPVISSSMISEGGNREVNGKGTLITTEAVEKGRNPNMSKLQMEAEYKRLLGTKKVIWLNQGLVEDDHTFLGPISTKDGTKAYTVVTTNGHVDEFVRFVNDSTILLAKIDSTELNDPIAFENNKRIEENYEILSKATDQDGKPFTIIRMPLPGTIYDTMSPGDYVYEYIKTLDYEDGSTFPNGDSVKVIAALSYLNFIITNKVIIGQTCWREGMPLELKSKDEKAAQILQFVFPNRKVIMIDALAVNLGGGGIHCISMQQPALSNN
ncbi:MULTISPECIES: agmatine/peptidylarginine deiminase [unclassified Polaribacter]|uniref:agmatine deiminase family protein n=1 Tax=unclassified Polaribacter TaxID=196858 RepID=UPI0011BDDABF|nr:MULTISPECIES: agmatine deiminase family protein [unclassified Polaribacter]TXD53158.1 agmatine deiminase family protein [Polaribacter sp. IC063]TXD61278.1 agmatine deiminase family protein [Polaribacter sp. IC066]